MEKKDDATSSSIYYSRQREHEGLQQQVAIPLMGTEDIIVLREYEQFPLYRRGVQSKTSV